MSIIIVSAEERTMALRLTTFTSFQEEVPAIISAERLSVQQ